VVGISKIKLMKKRTTKHDGNSSPLQFRSLRKTRHAKAAQVGASHARQGHILREPRFVHLSDTASVHDDETAVYNHAMIDYCEKEAPTKFE
jgi:hypothetical protein